MAGRPGPPGPLRRPGPASYPAARASRGRPAASISPTGLSVTTAANASASIVTRLGRSSPGRYRSSTATRSVSFSRARASSACASISTGPSPRSGCSCTTMRASASSRMMSWPLRSLNRTVFWPMIRPLFLNILRWGQHCRKPVRLSNICSIADSGLLPGTPLGEAVPVSRVVPEDRLDPVGALGGRLGELDAALDQRLVIAPAVRRGHDAGGEGALRDQPADGGRGLLVEHRMRRVHEQEILADVPRRTHGQPAHAVVELDVVGELEAQLLGVELLGRVLVEYPDRHDVDAVDHVPDSTRSAAPGASPEVTSSRSPGARRPVRHIKTKQPGMGAGPPRLAASARYPVGDVPVSSLNRVLNVPTLVKPTRWHISVTVRLTDLSSSQARSTRRRVRYRPGVSPNAARNARMKCSREYPASLASSAIGMSSG